MGRISIFIAALTVACSASAKWYWPFESKPADEKTPARMSALMEPASKLIDEARDLAVDGKTSESIEKYREALAALDLIEMENPERAKSVEFATLRNKRAYVNAAIDTMLMDQVRENAKSVAVCDTGPLELRLSRERWRRHADAARAAAGRKNAKLFLDELTRAREQTTNRVLRASLHGLVATAAFVTGDWEEICRALDQFLSELEPEPEIPVQDARDAMECLLDIRHLAVDWCEAAVASGEVARVAFDRLADFQRTNETVRAFGGNVKDVQGTNEVEETFLALHREVRENLLSQSRLLGAYPFSEATRLTNEADIVLRQLDNVAAPDMDLTLYDGALASFKSLVATFGGAKRRVLKIERRLLNKPGETGADDPDVTAAPERNPAPKAAPKPPPAPKAAPPRSRREQAILDISNGDFAAAEILIREMLEENPNGALALNLKATLELRQGKLAEADRTLDQAILSHPRSHFAYYNMAILLLQKNPNNKANAKRYYETGRTYGGPANPQLEALLK